MLDVLLARGYFPRELPPGFSTESYAAAFNGPIPDALSQPKPPKCAEILQHNLARAGRMRRKLGIPNPALFYPLAKEISDNWADIQRFTDERTLSATRPRLKADKGRAIVPESPFGERSNLRAKARAGSRYLLKADVVSFYHSIYTHSIPWAFHTRRTAKTDRTGGLLGNRLDTYVRRAQDDQTKGIPIGPDTSFVIAELILRRIDEELEDQLGPIRGFRSVDDYEICFQTLSDAERGLAALQSLLHNYELDLSALKTDIIQLPHWLDEPWTVPLSSHLLSDARNSDVGINQKYEITNFFTLTFSLARENPGASVIKYALGRIRRVKVSREGWDQYQQILLQCAVGESDTLSYVVPELEKYALLEYPIDSDLIGFALNDVVQKEAGIGHGNAVAWALWGLLVFGIQLSSPAARALSHIEDSVVAMLALDMRERGLTPADLDVTQWQAEVSPTGLYQKHWLLAFEAPLHGWLVPAEGDPARSDAVFQFFRDQHVAFYKPPKTVAQRIDEIRAREEAEGDYDLDFEIPGDDEGADSDSYFWNASS